MTDAYSKIKADRRVRQSKRLANLFARASKSETRREFDGAKQFKRRTLGFCGEDTILNLSQIAVILYKTGMADSVNEGKRIFENIVDDALEESLDVLYASGRQLRISLFNHGSIGVLKSYKICVIY